jgi:GDPmannose 4,6-dehydratase
VRQFVEKAAAQLGISLAFEGDGMMEVGVVAAVSDTRARCRVGDVVVRVDPRYFRPTEVETLLGDSSKARAKLGWQPRTTLDQLITEMVRSDYASAERDDLVRSAGYAVHPPHE